MKRFVISGRAIGFPIDMLRRDQCWPASKADSELIQASYGDRSGRARRWTIMLETDNAEKDVPSIADWKSFGIDITHQAEV
jgi:hypothetical protein